MIRYALAAALLLPGLAFAQGQAPAPPAAPFPASPPLQEGWVNKSTADVILLDKIRGQPTSLSIKAGESANFGSLTMAVRACAVRPPDQPADSTAFIEVTDARGTKDVFRGWIFANNPAVSQMQHPLYDLRLVSCH